MDRIIIERITCYAYHGVLLEEQTLGQEFQVSLELSFDLPDYTRDEITEVIDYRHAVALVEKVMYGPAKKLLETLAREIAEQLLTVEGVQEATVEVRKPNPPMPGVRGGVSVVVTRSR